jgi:FKBP-type peptidyl-prolyl cis-trans isomerase FklB
MLAALAVSLGVVLVAGCNRNEQAAAPETPAAPAAPAEAAPPAAAADLLSPEANQKFLTDNAAKEGVTTHPSGLQYRVIKAGAGAMPTSPADLVTVTYKGSLIDGTVFDQTEPGQSVEFEAGGLIQGWVLALQLMKEGDEWELVIPAELGYGAQGAGGVIPPNQTLVFTMGLQKVTKAPTP